MTTVLQIPIDKTIRSRAASSAQRMGFSSLQEAVRIFLNKMAAGQINVTLEESVQLSPMAIKRYDKIIDEIESGKANLKSFDDVDSMIKFLNGH